MTAFYRLFPVEGGAGNPTPLEGDPCILWHWSAANLNLARECVPILINHVEKDPVYYYPCVYAAAAVLGGLGDSRAVPVLTNLLLGVGNDQKIWLARVAATSLGRIGDSKAVPALTFRLLQREEEPDRKLMSSISVALGALRATEAVPALSNYLATAQNGTEDWKRFVAAVTLGRVGATNCAPLLRTMLHRVPGTKQEYDLCGAIKGLSLLGLADDVLTLTNELCAGGMQDDDVSDQLVDALIRLKRPETISLLTNLLMDPGITNNAMHAGAFAALAELKSAEAIPALTNLLVGFRPGGKPVIKEVREEAARVLGMTGGRSSMNALTNVLLHGEGEGFVSVEMKVAEALGRLGDPDAIGALTARMTNAVRDSDGEVRAAAALALGQLGDRTTVGALSNLLDYGVASANRGVAGVVDRNNERVAASTVQTAAAQALGLLRTPDAICALTNRAFGSDWEMGDSVQIALIRTIGRLRLTNAVPTIQKLLLSTLDEWMKHPGAGRKPFGVPKAIGLVNACADALEMIGSQSAAEAIALAITVPGDYRMMHLDNVSCAFSLGNEETVLTLLERAHGSSSVVMPARVLALYHSGTNEHLRVLCSYLGRPKKLRMPEEKDCQQHLAWLLSAFKSSSNRPQVQLEAADGIIWLIEKRKKWEQSDRPLLDKVLAALEKNPEVEERSSDYRKKILSAIAGTKQPLTPQEKACVAFVVINVLTGVLWRFAKRGGVWGWGPLMAWLVSGGGMSLIPTIEKAIQLDWKWLGGLLVGEFVFLTFGGLLARTPLLIVSRVEPLNQWIFAAFSGWDGAGGERAF
ncbi:MAG: HEAT repeat domain-containing protein, partial [Verrucomicrobiota bacterium]